MKAMTVMEGSERAKSHKSGSEFFICFTARPPSSAASCSAAMRVPSSKSLMSPGRGREPAAPSLSASLSRRLRSSGSMKGAQSPMFPAGEAVGGCRRKRSAFEAAEPSSPKVTCIGQVRVKSKKKKKNISNAVVRSRSQRSIGGEASFRRASEEGKRNQRWVYQLPINICEAVRAFGSEFNCILPCGRGRSPCSSSRTVEVKRGGEKRSRSSSSCGTMFARWLMAVQEESEEGKRGEVGSLVVEERDKPEVSFLVSKREMEGLGAEEVGNVGVVEDNEDEESRVSVCIPPRNALLLMRCRSDPVRVAVLADRFWGSPAAAKIPCADHDGGEEESGNGVREEDGYQDSREEEDEELGADLEKQSETVPLKTGELEKHDAAEEEVDDDEEDERPQHRANEEEGDDGFRADSVEMQRNPSKDFEEEPEVSQLQEEETHFLEEREKGEMKGKRSKGKEERRSSNCSSSSKAKEEGKRLSCSSKERERRRHSFSTEREVRRASFSVDREGGRRWSFALEKGELTPSKNREEMPIGPPDVMEAIEVESSETQVMVMATAEEGREGEEEEKGEDEKTVELPDCLLLMMYEPKLSMEVSKETWVCSTDFLRWSPHRPQTGGASEVGGGGNSYCSESKGATKAVEPALQPPPPPPLQPLPPPPPTSSVVEQKMVVSAVAPAVAAPYGPFVLTRCKSEPVRSSARLDPAGCLWKSRHRPIGAAAIGF